MHQWQKVVFALFVGCLAAVSTALASGREFVYVESDIQSANGNSIFAYERQSNGSLTPVAGSPFLTGGAGTQDTSLNVGPYDSDQSIAIDQRKRLLFAVNSGSDTIAVFHIQQDGSLKAVAGSPFPSGGTDPVSIGLAGDTAFVVNKNGDFPRPSNTLPNYTAFHVAADGSLAPVADSTVSVALGSSPSQALVAPNANLVFGADFFGGLLQSFRFDGQGRLHQRQATALPPSEFVNAPAAPRVALGLITHPRLPLLYAGFLTIGRVGVYRFNVLGDLSFVRSVPNSGQLVCWFRTNHSGTRMYTTNTGFFDTSSISVYDLTNPEEPQEIQIINLLGQGNARQFAISGDEKTLYAVASRFSAQIPDGQGNALHVFSIGTDGTLTEQAPITFALPTGSQPQGVASFSEN